MRRNEAVCICIKGPGSCSHLPITRSNVRHTYGQSCIMRWGVCMLCTQQNSRITCQRPAARNFSVLQRHLPTSFLVGSHSAHQHVWYSLFVVVLVALKTALRNSTAIVSLWIVIMVGQIPLTGLKYCEFVHHFRNLAALWGDVLNQPLSIAAPLHQGHLRISGAMIGEG